MSTNRRLVNRSRMNETASPAPPRRQQQRATETPARQPVRQIELPAYEPPSCPLSAEAQQKLNILRTNHNYSKYKTHIKSAISIVTTSAADSNERLSIRREEVQKTNDRRRRDGKADEDKDDDDINAERVLKLLETNVPEFTAQAEMAVRELIDYGDELSMQDAMMKDVSESIASAPVPEPHAPRRRRSPIGSDEENEEEAGEIEPPAEEPEQVSAINILKQVKGNYATEYKSKTLTSRYADHNDYKGFKDAIHVAQTLNSGEDPPHSSTWFPEEAATSKSRRRNNNTTDNTNNGDDNSSDDDDVVITNTSQRLTCPLTIAWFKDPVSNTKCKHSFEKKAIINHYNLEGRMYNDPNKPGEASKKVVKCPETGCDTMLSLDDFYDDAVLLRKVRYAQKKERVQAYDDDDDDDGPRGTQRNRPEDISEGDDDAVDVDEEDHRTKMARIKRERARSRGLSMAPSQSQTAASLDSDEEMTQD